MPITSIGKDLYLLPHPSGEQVKVGGSYIELPRFRGESLLKPTLQIAGKPVPELRGNRLAVGNAKIQLEQFVTPVNPLYNEFGGIDQVITLFSKPQSNQVIFDYDATKLIPYHQPPLTQAGIDEGCVRPIHVVNSIAWYHSSKGGLVSKADADKGITTGKAYHQYAMVATLPDRTKVMVGLVILNSSQYAYIIPEKEWANPDNYPMIISPIGDTFGYTDLGGSDSNSYAYYQQIKTNPVNYTSAAGTGTSMKIGARCTSGSAYVKLALYNTASPNALITNSATGVITINSSTKQWWEGSNSPTLEAIDYRPVFFGDSSGWYNNGSVAYDTIGAVGHYYAAATYPTFPSTVSSWTNSAYTVYFSIYQIYTPTGAPPPTVTAISPSYGTTAGGTSVTLTGTNFTGASGGTIGGVAITSFSVVNDTTITGVTPSGTMGNRDVVVTTSGGNGTLTNGFCYVTPVTNVSTVDRNSYQGSSTSNIRIPFQSKLFFAATRWWAFYEVVNSSFDGSIYFKSSTDGVTWNTSTLIASNYRDFEFASYWDGTTVTIVYCKQQADAHMYYRRGTPQTNGTISWDSNALDIYTPASGGTVLDLTATVNSNGYAFIGFEFLLSGTYKPHVLKNANNNGTWTTDTDDTLEATGSPYSYTCSVHALTSGKVYALYAVMTGSSNETIKGRLWDSGWGSQEVASALYLDQAFYDMWMAVAIGDDVHLIFNEATTSDLEYTKRTYGAGWGSAATVQASTTNQTAPTIGANGTNLAVFWLDTTKLYVKNCISGSWDASPITVADETSNTILVVTGIQTTQSATTNVFGVLYEIRTTLPYFVRFASYEKVNTVLTPGTLALATTGYAPIPGYIYTPPTLSLAITKYAPVIEAVIIVPVKALIITPYSPVFGDGVIPITLALATTSYEPIISSSSAQVVTPIYKALTITRYAPVLKVVIPAGLLELVTTTYEPTVSVSGGIVVTPGYRTITITKYIPVLKVSVIPTTKTLSITTYIPVINAIGSIAVTPGTLSLTITRYIPTILLPILVTPSTLSLVLSLYLPLSIYGVVPPTLILSITSYIPLVTAPALAIPATLALIITGYIPYTSSIGEFLDVVLFAKPYRDATLYTRPYRDAIIYSGED